MNFRDMAITGNSKKIGFVETPLEIARLMVKLSTVKKNSSVLDTGCGMGVFLDELDKAGYTNCYGIEIDQELYEVCKRKFEGKYTILLSDFLTFNPKEKFDLIIGNPPYVHFNQLTLETQEITKKILKTRECDIYYAFILKSIELLKDNGELIYIVPYHFFYNTYAKMLREYILHYGKFEIIIDLDETRIFNEENPETIIFKFIKGKFDLKQEKIILLNIKRKNSKPSEIYEKSLSALETKKSNDLFTYNVIPHYTTIEPWSTFYINIPRFKYVKLKEISKVGVGFVSGFDKAFILNGNEKLTQEEQKMVKKFIKSQNCERYFTKGYVSYIFIDDNIKDEEHLKRNYPNIYAKLLFYKEEMSNRYLNKKNWFNWQALRNYDFLMKNLNKKLIYVPVLDRRPYNRFSLGEEKLLPSGDVLFIHPFNEDDLYFLLGYLNSSFFRDYYLAKGGRRGGRIAFTQRLLENVEIPLFSEETKSNIINIVLKILNNKNDIEKIYELDKELDFIIRSQLK